MRPRLALALLVPLAALATGCGVDVTIDEGYADRAPTTVAILPFDAPEPEEREDIEVTLIRRLFYNHWANLGFRTMPIEMTDRILAMNGMGTYEATRSASAAQIGEILGVDAVIYGHVTDISNIAPGILYRRAVSGQVELIDARGDGASTVLWKAEHTEDDWGGPLIDSGQVIRGIRDQIANSSALAYYKISDNFCRNIVESAPPPREGFDPTAHIPEIVRVEARTTGSAVLRAGDRIDVVMNGDPDLIAHFDIGTVRSRISMVQIGTGTGIYRGSYVVQPGDHAMDVAIRAALSTSFGESQVSEANVRVSLRARPPFIPMDLTLEPEGSGVRLRWKRGTGGPTGLAAEEDEAARVGLQREAPAASNFIVYRAVGDPSDFKRLGVTTVELTFKDDNPGGSAVWYAVAAADELGNRSYPTACISIAEPKPEEN